MNEAFVIDGSGRRTLTKGCSLPRVFRALLRFFPLRSPPACARQTSSNPPTRSDRIPDQLSLAVDALVRFIEVEEKTTTGMAEEELDNAAKRGSRPHEHLSSAA